MKKSIQNKIYTIGSIYVMFDEDLLESKKETFKTRKNKYGI